MDKNELKLKMCYTFTNMRRSFKSRLRKLNLSFQQWNVLKVIRNSYDPVSAKQIVEEIDSDKATVSGIVKRLVASDFVYEKKNPEDRRETLLFLSQKSIDLFEEISIMERKFNQELFSDFEPEDLDKLDTLLTKVTIPEQYL